jgi:hypothetical protein
MISSGVAAVSEPIRNKRRNDLKLIFMFINGTKNTVDRIPKGLEDGTSSEMKLCVPLLYTRCAVG